jgi:YcaO-like protein with predicted kinase domain
MAMNIAGGVGPKGHVRGTHRTRSPEDTVRDYSRHFEAFGITRLANVTGLDRVGIPVYLAVRPNARSLSVSQGKGLTAPAAKASAMMESIENWHAEHISKPLRYESPRALLSSNEVVDLQALPLRAGGVLRQEVPRLWIEGEDIMSGRPAWLPFEFVHVNTVLPPGQELTFFNSTNGLASGNHLLEATLHGLLEVIERDAISLWRLRPLFGREPSRIDLSTVVDADNRALIDRFLAAEIAVSAWDITSDLEIPTFACAVADEPGRTTWHYPGVEWGFGCHLSPEIALGRALTEAAQSRLTLISGSRDDNPHAVYEKWRTPGFREAETGKYFDGGPGRPFRGDAAGTTDSFGGDLNVVLDRLRNRGLHSVVVVDLTDPKFCIPVTKVVVPGLELLIHTEQPCFQARAKRLLSELAA